MSEHDNNNQPTALNNGQQMMSENEQQVMSNGNLGGQNSTTVQPVVNNMGASPNLANNVYPQQDLNGTYNFPQENNTLNQQNLGMAPVDTSYPQVQQPVNNMGASPNLANNIYSQQNLNSTIGVQQVSTSNPNLAYNQNPNSTQAVNNSQLTGATQITNNQQVTGGDEELLKAFIGNNYDKITTKKFNFAGFFMPIPYLFYRKMFLYGFLTFIIHFIITNFISSRLSIIVNVLLGLFVNKIYLRFASRKINKIKVNNAQADINSLLQISARKGGASIVGAIGATTVLFVVTIVITITGFTVSIFNFLNSNEDIKPGENYNASDDKNNNTFDGMLSYNTSIKINDEFSISVPSKFEDKSDSYEYNFEYDGTEGIFNTCGVSLSVINGYNDGSKLIEQMATYYSSDSPSEVTTVKLNGTNWKSFSLNDSFGTTYYYGTTKDKKAYLLEYEINEDADSDCASYREEILSSIKAK